MSTSPPTNAPIPVQDRRDRPKRTWKWRLLWGSLAVAVGLVVTGGIYHFFQTNRISALHAHLDATQFPWRWDDLIRTGEPVPENENAVLAIEKFVAKHAIDTSLNLEKARDPAALLGGETRVQFLEWAEKHQAPLAAALTLKDFKRGRLPVPTNFWDINARVRRSPGLATFYMLARTGAILRADEQDADKAFAYLKILFLTTRILYQEKDWVVVSSHSAMAEAFAKAVEEVLAKTEAKEAMVAELQEELLPHVNEDFRIPSLRGYRAFVAKLYEGYSDGKLREQMVGTGAGSQAIALYDVIPSTYIHQNYAEFMEWMEQEMERAKQPIPKMLSTPNPRGSRFHRSWNMVGQFMGPQVETFLRSAAKAQALARLTTTALAAERYRIRHGDWPATVDALVADKILPEIPLDPFDDQPLRIRRWDKGLLIYALGLNLADDQGKLFDPTRGDHEGDMVFRLWDLSQRREPFEPEKK